MSEFCLSDKINFGNFISKIPNDTDTIKASDVKEFIRLLKEAGSESDWDIMLDNGDGEDITISFNDWIDKLAGDKLTE